MKPRRQRGKSGPRSLLQLTSRDQEILLLLGLCRYLSTDQIAREFFPSVDRARRRLRQILDAKLVRVTLASSTAPNLLSLTANGLKIVQRLWPEAGQGLYLPGPISMASIVHHLALQDVRLYLSHLAQDEGGRLLAWSSGQGGMAKRLGFQGLVPDALAELELGTDRITLALEVDCGTESLALIQAKLKRYQPLLTQETVDELWIILTGGAGRQQHLRDLVLDQGMGEKCRVMSQEHLLDQPVYKPGPRVAEEEKGQRPLISPSPSTASSFSSTTSNSIGRR